MIVTPKKTTKIFAFHTPLKSKTLRRKSKTLLDCMCIHDARNIVLEFLHKGVHYSIIALLSKEFSECIDGIFKYNDESGGYMLRSILKERFWYYRQFFLWFNFADEYYEYYEDAKH